MERASSEMTRTWQQDTTSLIKIDDDLDGTMVLLFLRCIPQQDEDDPISNLVCFANPLSTILLVAQATKH